MYDANYRAARRRVEAKIGFFTHLAVYLCVNAGLMMLNLQQWLTHGHARPWVLGPLLGWGLGLLIHGLRVWLRWPPHWKQEWIARELDKQNSCQNK